MTGAAPQAMAVTRALSAVMHQDRGRLMAALVARLGDFQRAEDALQEAGISALLHWGRPGLPDCPRAWLFKVAMRKALDRLRAEGRSAKRETALAQLTPLETVEATEDIPDERLRLIFTCCHPALEEKSRVALTLRTVCGLTTEEIARVFLDTAPTMGQRLSRAKSKIALAGIPFAIPGPEAWDERLHTVLTTIYLIFTTGYTAGPDEPRNLCAEAIFLCRLLLALRPGQAEIEGALALMLLTDARRAARIGADGATVPPSEQDRALWDMQGLDEGRALLHTALMRKRSGPFQIKAAISACHMADAGPDWPQILQLYTVLLTLEPTAVVRLNHAVALAETGFVAAAQAAIAALRPELDGFQPLHAAAAVIHARAGAWEDARRDGLAAIAGADREADRLLLRKLLEGLESPECDPDPAPDDGRPNSL
jgi:RNA polymerase sigma-70 factor (ECF subfamily)